MITFPEGFNVVDPVAAQRGDHIKIKVSVDKKQIVSFSFNAEAAATIGLDETKKAVVAVNQATAAVMIAAVDAEQAGWEVSLSKGEVQRTVVRVPMPALFNQVVAPFRSTAMSGMFELDNSAAIIDFSGILAGEAKDDASDDSVKESLL